MDGRTSEYRIDRWMSGHTCIDKVNGLVDKYMDQWMDGWSSG